MTITRRDPRSLTNLQEVLTTLSVFQSEDAELSNSLQDLLATREPIVSSINRLQALVPRIDDLHNEANMLSTKVEVTALTAERVGGRVRSLDEEMRRIRDASDRVNQVIELKSSLASVTEAIDSEDWESAARHCARVMALPNQVIAGPFAESVVPTSDSHLPPLQTLQAHREHLLDVFKRNFEEASASRDSTATSRFFKLFPAIGWEKEGLEAYAAFVVDLVRVRAPASAKTSSPLYYITALTALFESIAMIVDQHQPVVEKYYGPGNMKLVVQRLLDECDRVVKVLMDGWEEERSMKRKLNDVKNNPPTPLFSTAPRRQAPNGGEEDVVDPREIDKVLTEVAAMAGRWHLFQKFLLENMFVSNDESTPLSFESTLSASIFENTLQTYYTPMESWYMRTIIDKAQRMSSPDLTQAIASTTAPDDVFYILKVITNRLLTTGSVPTVERTLNHLREIIERDFVGVLKRKMDDVYRAGPSSRGERENRASFITIINDLDISGSHLDRLTKDLLVSPTIGQHFMGSYQSSVKTHITSFSNAGTKIRSTVQMGVEQLFNQLMRPKLRNFVTDIYKDVSYVLDDDSYASAEYNDLVRKRFIKSWENVTDGYKDTFTENNYRIFFALTLDVVLRPWEKLIMSFKFTELGAIRFDRDLRSITTYLFAQTTFAGDARSKFTRLHQISTLLNLDSEDDVDDFYNSSGISWMLSLKEARSIAALMV